jgi:hypothetical protein
MAASTLQRNNVTVSGKGSRALVFAHGFCAAPGVA